MFPKNPVLPKCILGYIFFNFTDYDTIKICYLNVYFLVQNHIGFTFFLSNPTNCNF